MPEGPGPTIDFYQLVRSDLERKLGEHVVAHGPINEHALIYVGV